MHQICGIGEILWDIFPHGPRFGGAPANFASAIAGLAGPSVHVSMWSAVGEDELGRIAIETLKRRQVDTSMIQVRFSKTGQVHVEVDEAGHARYRFDSYSAWDELQWNESVASLADQYDAICFGTLGQRASASRHSIRSFLKRAPRRSLRILDVNLRAPFFDESIVRDSLALANVLKLSDEELPYVGRSIGAVGSDLEIMRQLVDHYQLRYLALTRGAAGALMMSPSELSDLPGVPVKVADTVGAGDAFTAAMTLGLLANQTLDVINRAAILVASFVCSQTGAGTRFPNDLLPWLLAD
jgi:fructokinase